MYQEGLEWKILSWYNLLNTLFIVLSVASIRYREIRFFFLIDSGIFIYDRSRNSYGKQMMEWYSCSLQGTSLTVLWTDLTNVQSMRKRNGRMGVESQEHTLKLMLYSTWSSLSLFNSPSSGWYTPKESCKYCFRMVSSIISLNPNNPILISNGYSNCVYFYRIS